jgi:predicted lactoylglutathione lyase
MKITASLTLIWKHSFTAMLITPAQFRNLVKGRPDEADLKERAKSHMQGLRGGMATRRVLR